MHDMIEPFVIRGEGVLTPPGRDRWVTEEMFRQRERAPEFSVQEVAEVFFGHSATWLRKKLWERSQVWQPSRSDAGHRQFGLHQIEDLAHLLLGEGVLKPLPFAMVIRHVKASAIQYRYEIGDTGFLMEHWNGALMRRRKIVIQVMDRLEDWDAGRLTTSHTEAERAVDEAAIAIRRAETLLQED